MIYPKENEIFILHKNFANPNIVYEHEVLISLNWAP